jgi:hypothetical protein
MGDNLESVADCLTGEAAYGSLREVYSATLIETCHNLMGRYEDPLFLSGDSLEDTSVNSSGIDLGSTELWILFFKIFLTIHLDQFFAAERLMSQFKRLTRKQLLPNLLENVALFYEGLIAAVLAAKADCRHRRARLNLAQKVLRKLRSAKKEEDPIFRNKVLLLDAQLHACSAQHETALLLFHKSMDLAEDEGLSHEQALAYELAGRMCQGCCRSIEAGLYFAQAREFYGLWGARAKVEQLDQEIGFPDRSGSSNHGKIRLY